MKNFKLPHFTKFNLKRLVFSALFVCFTPSFLQAHSPVFHGYPHPSVNSCFAPSSFCQTYSGHICPIVRYAPQSFSACLTSGYFCINTPLYQQTASCVLRGSPCVCAYPHVDYFHGTTHYVYENGFAF